MPPKCLCLQKAMPVCKYFWSIILSLCARLGAPSSTYYVSIKNEPLGTGLYSRFSATFWEMMPQTSIRSLALLPSVPMCPCLLFQPWSWQCRFAAMASLSDQASAETGFCLDRTEAACIHAWQPSFVRRGSSLLNLSVFLSASNLLAQNVNAR